MLTPVEHAPLAPHCTLRLGGPARYLVEATDEATVAEAVQWAASRKLPVRVLGGGSNLVIADEGVDGLVLKIALRGVTAREIPGAVEVTAAAGEPWDDFVRHTVERGWAGLECLSGIPGLVGATPDPERGRLRPGGERHARLGARARPRERPRRDARARRVRLRLPRQPLQEPRPRPLRRPRRHLPARPGRGALSRLCRHRARGRERVAPAVHRARDRDPGAPLQVHGARPGRSERAELRVLLPESHRGRGRARRDRGARGRPVDAALAAARRPA